MKIEGTYQISAPRELVFQKLTDPKVLQRSLPGCEKLDQTDENNFALTIRAGVGSIKGLFNGIVRMEQLHPPERFRLVVEGKGTPGFLKGAGALELEERDGGTLISYSGDVQVGGTIAGVGQRMILGSAKMMATQFFTAIEAEAKATPDQPPPKHGFFRTALRWFSGFLKRQFGRQ
jgi:carbon monoxide dehydrogenase subunit G